MYIKVTDLEPDGTLSWKLCKNPASPPLEKMDGNRKFVGKFDGENSYELTVENDPLDFLRMARDMNMAAYLHENFTSVCPYNLKVMDGVLRSIMHGNNATGGNLTDEKVFEPKLWEMIVGPYPNKSVAVTEAFGELGLMALPIEDDKTTSVYMFKILNTEKISLTDMLQKVYVLSVYLTCIAKKKTMYNVSEEQITKFIKLSKTWLYESAIKNKIVNKLCRYNKKYITFFETELATKIEDDDIRSEAIKKCEEYVTKVSLHSKRHQLVLDTLETIQAKSLVDIASSDGDMIKKILASYSLKDEIKILGMDTHNIKMRKLNRKIGSHNVRFISTNALVPNINETDCKPDVLTCIEFIEHLKQSDRSLLIKLIKDIYVPEYIVLTTPNVSYNVKFEIPPGTYRRNDHIIEYTEEQFIEEVVTPLSYKYDIFNVDLVPDEDMQPTFCILCKRKENDSRMIDKKFLKIMRDMYDSIYLPVSDNLITPKEISFGYTERAFIKNKENIFYLAPTIAPVEYNEEVPDYLEHPSAAFDYFKKRGITQIVEEEKYMGSRGHILCFKSLEHATSFGFKSPLIINSRGGYSYFDDIEHKDILDRIYEELTNHMEPDFVILDAEMLPWKFKAEKMILHDFLAPGECTYLSRKYGKRDTSTAEEYLKTINEFGKDDDVSIRVFHYLASGNVEFDKKNRPHMKVDKYGYNMNHIEHVRSINNLLYPKKSLDLNICKTVNYKVVYLDDEKSMNESIERWKKYCEENYGEGFVYKPYDFTTCLKDGYYAQPALKVRGKEYLRIVYGIDYLTPDYFQQVKKRNISKKRSLAVKEFEMSKIILSCFLNNNKTQLYKNIAAFLGTEGSSMGMDATL